MFEVDLSDVLIYQVIVKAIQLNNLASESVSFCKLFNETCISRCDDAITQLETYTCRLDRCTLALCGKIVQVIVYRSRKTPNDGQINMMQRLCYCMQIDHYHCQQVSGYLSV